MHRSKTLWIGLVCLVCLWPTAWAQGQRTVSELIQSIKAQKERELDPRLASPNPLPSPPRTQAMPRSLLPAAPPPSVVSVAPPIRTAPVIKAEAPVAALGGSSAAPQAAAPIRPEPWPLVLLLAGVNDHHHTQLMIERRVYPVTAEELPLTIEGWLILSISESEVCLSRQGLSRCLRPHEGGRMTTAATQRPSLPSIKGEERLDPGGRP
jgi:hypothetical protein